MTRTRGPARGGTETERGQVSLMIIGFTLVLLMTAAVVVNASAAYLHRQGLATVADGAALTGADLGVAGIYDEGIPQQRLMPLPEEVRAAVADYLTRTGARQRYPDLRADVRVDVGARTVEVVLRSRRQFLLRLPGLPQHADVAARGRAAVAVRR